MAFVHSFAPIENPRAQVLILGSMPGIASLRAGQYYAHPRNLFWQIIGEIIDCESTLPYAQRIAGLQSSGIALWDVIALCTRESSLDANIDKASIVPNDFKSFFARHPALTHVFFNGGAAEQSFKRHVRPQMQRTLIYTRLPSTSPAHAARSFESKLQIWRDAIAPVLAART